MAALLAGLMVLVLSIMGAAWKNKFESGCPIDPIVVDLGPLPERTGFWAPEFNLEKLERIYTGDGPEDLAVDSDGMVYTATKDGWIKRISLDGTVENFTHVGSPSAIGLAFGPGEDFYLAVPREGLFKVSKDGVKEHLSKEADGSPILFANGVVVAKDGTAYFSDVSTKYGLGKEMSDLSEGRPNGRVLKYDPSTRSTTVFIKDLAFPNGVQLSKDEDFLLISEISRARVLGYWLKGEKEGTLETFIDTLPGFPDNIRLGDDGNFYIALPGERTAISDWIFRTPNKFLRCLTVNEFVLRLFSNIGRGQVLVVSPKGELLKKYEDPTGMKMHYITGANKIGDFVYFSSFETDFIGRIKL